jgi:formate dehydrogenase maturation protein FdhE
VTLPAVAADPWTERRRRAADLAARWPFAAEVLEFYRALAGVQAEVYEAAVADRVDPGRVPAYTAARALPPVRDVTISHAPEKLARAAAGASPGRWEEAVRVWLADGDLPPVDRYLVRAAAGPVLEALGEDAGKACPGAREDRRCPRCGGPPQVSLFAPSAEDFVTPRRYLECARCAWRWPCARMTCAACGELETRQLPIFAEEGTMLVETAGTVVRGAGGATPAAPAGYVPFFPHMSVHGCRSCGRYLLNVDLSRDARAVPVVDDIAAIPLSLYAAEHGFVKVVPNLMGL